MKITLQAKDTFRWRITDGCTSEFQCCRRENSGCGGGSFIESKIHSYRYTWKKLMKNVDIEEPTSFLDHVHSGCTQRECQPNDTIIEEYKKIFEPRISAGTTEKLPGWEKSRSKVSAWVLRHERTCWKMRETVLRIGKQEDRAITHGFQSLLGRSPNKERRIGEYWWIVTSLFTCCLEMCSWKELVNQTYCGKSTNWHDLSQNGLKHVTDDWHGYFLTFISRVITANIVMGAMRLNIVDWDHFKIQTLQEILKTQNQHQADGVLYIFRSRTFVPITWMCKKQTSVSHSSSEWEIISFDAGLRMDGLFALDLWDLVIEVLGTTQRIPKPTQACTRETGVKTQITPKIKLVLDQKADLSNMVQVPSNPHLSEKESQLYFFEGKEAVIKMIIKGRSPTMRHVSRTHKVAFEWLFDRINLDPKIQNAWRME